MTCEKPNNSNKEINNLIPKNKASTSVGSNITVDQSGKNQEMLEDFVHDALTEIAFDDNADGDSTSDDAVHGGDR